MGVGVVMWQAWGECQVRGKLLASDSLWFSQKKQLKPTEVPRLQLSSGFAWDVSLDMLTPAVPPREESSDSEEEEASQATVWSSLGAFSDSLSKDCFPKPSLVMGGPALDTLDRGESLNLPPKASWEASNLAQYKPQGSGKM